MNRLSYRRLACGPATFVAIALGGACSPSRSAKPSAPPVVVVTASEYKLLLPDTLEAGPTILQLVSAGRERHAMPMVQLAAGHAVDDVRAALQHHQLAIPGLTAVGGVGTIEPGDTASATIDLAPGFYVAWCDIPAPDGTPHYMKGMLSLITVVDRKNGATMPVADDSVMLSDSAVALSAPLAAGAHVVAVRNSGRQPHMALLWKLNGGKSEADVVNWIAAAKPTSPAPGTMIGGIAALSPGQRAEMNVKLAAGRYVVVGMANDAPAETPRDIKPLVHEFSVDESR